MLYLHFTFYMLFDENIFFFTRLYSLSGHPTVCTWKFGQDIPAEEQQLPLYLTAPTVNKLGVMTSENKEQQNIK